MFEWFKKRKADKQKEKEQAKVAEKQKEEEKKIEQKSKPTTIKYNPILIDTLKLEHKRLLEIYTDILEALRVQNFTLASKKLTEFGQGLRAHLLREHIELYVYLEYMLAHDSETFKKMHALRAEMDGISAKVMAFLHAHENDKLNLTTVDSFKKEFFAVGKILSSRIEREEKSLYTLYKSA